MSPGTFSKGRTPKRSIVEAEGVAALLLFAEVDAVPSEGDIVLLKEDTDGEHGAWGKVGSGQSFVGFNAAEAVVAGD